MKSRFNTTQWTLVRAAGGDHSGNARTALASLCETYWYPLYAYVRRQGHAADEAQDLTQAFFMRLMEKHSVRAARPERGRSTCSRSAAAVSIGPAGHAGAPWLRHLVRGREPHNGSDERPRPRRAMATSHVSRPLRRPASVLRRDDDCRSTSVSGARDDTCAHTGDRGTGGRPGCGVDAAQRSGRRRSRRARDCTSRGDLDPRSRARASGRIQ